MARVSDGTDVPLSLVPASSPNMGSHNGSLPDFEGTGFCGCTMEKNNEIFKRIKKLPLLMKSFSRDSKKCVQTLSQTVASSDAKITSI